MKCSYCSRDEADYKGVYVVDSVSGKVRYFCSGKCRRNASMQRVKKKWTKPLVEQKTN